MTNWTRAELKARAKDCLRIYYWPAFGVSLVSMILTGGMTQTGSGIGAVGVAEQCIFYCRTFHGRTECN